MLCHSGAFKGDCVYESVGCSFSLNHTILLVCDICVAPEAQQQHKKLYLYFQVITTCVTTKL